MKNGGIIGPDIYMYEECRAQGPWKTLWKPFLTIFSPKGTGQEVIIKILMVNKKYPQNSRLDKKEPLSNYHISEPFLNPSK